MNLIGTSCVSSFITTEHLHEQLSNPFAWSIIKYESMYNLIKYWHSINFNNIQIQKDNNWNFSLIIDNKVTVDYVHYKFSPTATKLYTKGHNIYKNNIWEYIVEKYYERLNRMYKNNEKPLFIIADLQQQRAGNYTLQQMLELSKLTDNIIFSGKYNTTDLKNYHLTNLKYGPSWNKHLATEIYTKFKLQFFT